ncbi:hypothetical protein DSD19_04585 [Rhodovulum sp. BSW8]|uniref:hypothetical protein n=1 Tax=Rhodovulum sp. BSW8 TaxID=2259645 RepID=UPI000DE2B886|nr:hypothetical protein [Rhodovulum sp. BSW8]RBO54658.1 hypothetical protein DSD19_04585 [Rhodovulum sp. BSW8]
MPPEYDKDLLTPEEIAALEADEGAEIDGSAALDEEVHPSWRPAKAGADDDDDDGTVEDEDEDDDDGAPDGAATPGNDAAPPKIEIPDDHPGLAGFASKIADIEAQLDKIVEDYDNADLTKEEYTQQRAQLLKDQRQVAGDMAVTRHKIEQDTRDWNDATGAYRKAYPDLWAGGNVTQGFDRMVRFVTGSEAYADMTYAQQLEEAHRLLQHEAGRTKLEGVPEIKEKKHRRRQQVDPAADPTGKELHTPPTTLARVSASDITDADDGKYAALERVMRTGTPEEQEAALAKLSPDERDAFSSAM